MEDNEGYTVLNLQPKRGNSAHPTPDGSQESSLRTCYYKNALGILGACCILLMLAGIALGAWGGSGCKVCPWNWLPHRDRCYWLSKENKFWSESSKDCKMMKSQMLVIKDREEMEFIYNITQGTDLVWLGLTVKLPERKWTWVDNSPLDQSLYHGCHCSGKCIRCEHKFASFPVTGSAEGNSCGMIRRNRINSESCNTEFKWICQMGAILL